MKAMITDITAPESIKAPENAFNRTSEGYSIRRNGLPSITSKNNLNVTLTIIPTMLCKVLLTKKFTFFILRLITQETEKQVADPKAKRIPIIFSLEFGPSLCLLTVDQLTSISPIKQSIMPIISNQWIGSPLRIKPSNDMMNGLVLKMIKISDTGA
jgi:hypothetical protein